MAKEKQQQINYQLLLFKTRIFEDCRGSFRCFYESVASGSAGVMLPLSRVHEDCSMRILLLHILHHRGRNPQ